MFPERPSLCFFIPLKIFPPPCKKKRENCVHRRHVVIGNFPCTQVQRNFLWHRQSFRDYENVGLSTIQRLKLHMQSLYHDDAETQNRLLRSKYSLVVRALCIVVVFVFFSTKMFIRGFVYRLQQCSKLGQRNWCCLHFDANKINFYILLFDMSDFEILAQYPYFQLSHSLRTIQMPLLCYHLTYICIYYIQQCYYSTSATSIPNLN